MIWLGSLVTIQTKAVPSPPLTPPTLRAASVVGNTMQFEEGKITVTTKPLNACVKGKKSYGLDALPLLPGGRAYSKPWLLAIPRRYVLMNWSDQENGDLLFEIEVTNRGGEPTIVKGWTLCLVRDGKPLRYSDDEIPVQDIASLGQNPVPLANLGLNHPIEHGHAESGWLLFHVPKKDLGDLVLLNGALECRDYLEHRYSIVFTTPAGKQVDTPPRVPGAHRP
jgi:hypothetical protein